MRNFLLATTALLGLSASALAADLPARRAPAPFVAVPVFTWTGFYVGVNAGYVFDHDSTFRQSNGTVAPAASGLGVARPFTARVPDDGVTAGGQIGYNFQIGNAVIGIEADAAWTDIGRRVTIGGPGAPATLNTFRADLDYLGTVRGRLGWAFDRVMIYGTGGFAYGDVTQTVTFFNSPAVLGGSPRFTRTRSSTETGWVAGGGVEWAIPTDSAFAFLNFFGTSAATIKVEGLHYDLGSRTYFIDPVIGGGAVGGGSYATRVRTDGNLVRVGLNYKF